VAAVLPPSGLRLLVLNHEFGSAWHRFLHPDGGTDQTLSFTLGHEHLPFYARGKNITLTKVDLIVESPETGSFAVKLKVPGAAAASDEAMDPDAAYGGRQHLAKAFPNAANAPLLGEWQIQIRKAADTDFRSLEPEDVRNAYLVLGFKMS
jgi:hypothetical protein